MDRLLDELLAVWLGDAVEALLSYDGGRLDSWSRAVALDEPTAERVALIIVRSIATARRSGPRSLDDDGVSGAASDLVDLCAAGFDEGAYQLIGELSVNGELPAILTALLGQVATGLHGG